MKLGFIADNHLEGVEHDARFAAEHGFAGLEFNYWGTFADLTLETVQQMRRILDDHKVGCCMLGLWGWNHLALDADERGRAHLMLQRAIDFARVLGAEVLTTGGGQMPQRSAAEHIREFVHVVGPFVERIVAAGMKPAFYAVHGASFFDTLATYEQV